MAVLAAKSLLPAGNGLPGSRRVPATARASRKVPGSSQNVKPGTGSWRDLKGHQRPQREPRSQTSNALVSEHRRAPATYQSPARCLISFGGFGVKSAGRCATGCESEATDFSWLRVTGLACDGKLADGSTPQGLESLRLLLAASPRPETWQSIRESLRVGLGFRGAFIFEHSCHYLDILTLSQNPIRSCNTHNPW